MPQPPQRHDQDYLDMPEEENASEHLDSQVQKAHEALLSLKRQQDQIEKQKRELEELSRRQEILQAGRAEMVERFTRTMVVLDRETYDAQKRVELLQSIRATFDSHLVNLESINPKAWEGLDINRELTKAISAVDDAKAEFHKSLPKISVETTNDGNDPVAASGGFQMEYDGPAEHSFGHWLKIGFAFTLPLFFIGVLIAIALFASSSREAARPVAAPASAQGS